jgi:histidinol phosphatase-like enzyme
MILKAQREHGLDLPASVLFGDALSDLQAAKLAGVGRALWVNADLPDSAAVPFLSAVDQIVCAA